MTHFSLTCDKVKDFRLISPLDYNGEVYVGASAISKFMK